MTTLGLHPTQHPVWAPEIPEPERAPFGDQWGHADAFVIRHLVADPTLDPLRLMATALRPAADADCVLVLTTPRDGDDLETLIALGHRAADVASRILADVPELPQAVCRTGEPLHVLDAIGSILLLPLPRAAGHGVVVAVRFSHRPNFALEDLASAARFARHAAALAELSAARADQHRFDTAALQERIAAALHGEISRALFTVSLDLCAIAAGLGADPLAGRVTAAILDLDRVIAQVRVATLDGAKPAATLPLSLQSRVLGVVAELAPALGFEPTLLLAGFSSDTAACEDIRDDVVAVLRRRLTDVASDGRAGAVSVALDLTGERLTLEVIDDSGREPAGTRVRWSTSRQ